MDKLEEGCVKSESAREMITMPQLPKSLSLEEKKFLLAVERGDLANVKRMMQKAKRHGHINLNCMDPLGRGALLMAIDNENLQMVELLVVMGIETKDALLHAIDKEFVEAVELLLEHEELIHKDGEPYSWEKVDRTLASFTPDITPLILAAHRNNYEILKILLDRGANLPMPHDVRCGCVECIRGVQEDSLRHSMSRINAYRALASPSLIALSSTDPILTAFELSVELKNLAYAETEFRQEYMNLRGQCQDFAVELLGHTRSSQELAILLNHDPASPPYEDGDHMKLARLELAIDYKQKKFVAHPNIQQLLGAIWYEGLPGFRRKSLVQKLTEISKIALLFPLYCLLYMVAPSTQMGQLMRKPFMKFLIHASSYLFFLFLLILVSQRFEVLVVQLLGTTSMKRALEDQLRKQRGNGPTYLECIVVIYVLGYICEDVKELWKEGLSKYVRNMWNFIELFRNMAYLLVIVFRVVAYIQQQQEIALNPATAYIPREEWDDFDPQLIAEGIFAMANIFSAVKLVHLFSINPYLGPLQISLGRMVIDIVKFFFIYSLVLFAFACGLNQLLWYFSDLERQKCYSLPGGLPDWNKNPDACLKWRRFANLFESSQSLFWASFGLVDLTNFELTGVKTYTRFWGMLMFGSYSVINVVVLLNLLIAMMSNSYSLITEHSDTEWKFARSKLWMSYFEEGGTLPPPFNLFPTPKDLSRVLGLRNKDKLRQMSSKRKQSKQRERDYRYSSVMRALVWRFVTMMHRKQEMSEVTEDDVNEVKGDISSLRFELLDVFKANGMDISAASKTTKAVLGRKMRVWERRLLRDFHVVSVAGEDPNGDGAAAEGSQETDENDPAEKFRRLAMMVISKNASGAAGSSKREIKPMSQIGRSLSSDSFQSSQNLRKAMEEAKRLAVMEPTPEGSLRGSPLPNIDTGASVLELLQNIAEEEKQQQQDPGTDPKKESEKLLLPWKPTKNENKNTKPKTIPKPRPPLPKEASTESKGKEIKPTIKLQEPQKVKDQSGATKESPEVSQGTEKPKEVSQLVIKNEQSVEPSTETKKEDKRVAKRSAPVAPAVVPGAGPSAPEATIPPSLSAEKVDTKKAASPGLPGPSTPDSTPTTSTPGSSAPASTISPPAGPAVATPPAETVEIKISAIPGLAACSSTPDSTACLMPEKADIKISISPEPTATIDLVAMETDVPFKVPEFVSTQLPIAANAEEEKVAFATSAVDEIPKPVKKCESPTEVKSDENKTAPDTSLIPPKSVTDVKTIKRDPRSGWL